MTDTTTKPRKKYLKRRDYSSSAERVLDWLDTEYKILPHAFEVANKDEWEEVRKKMYWHDAGWVVVDLEVGRWAFTDDDTIGERIEIPPVLETLQAHIDAGRTVRFGGKWLGFLQPQVAMADVYCSGMAGRPTRLLTANERAIASKAMGVFVAQLEAEHQTLKRVSRSATAIAAAKATAEEAQRAWNALNKLTTEEPKQ